jgi:hypothetical protein
MRFRLLRRRLTISAPTMAIRSHAPWPLRWAMAAVMLGFCAAIGLWAFEFGKGIAGLDSNAKEELAQLKDEVVKLREDRDKAQSIANTSGSLLTAEKAAQDKLAVQVKLLENENRALRDDLGFFEKLMPVGGTEGIAIRGLQGEVLGGGTQIKWQVLVIQPTKNAPDFNGKIELTFGGTQAGKPWSMPLPGGVQPLQFKQSRRLEGVLDLPPQVVVKTLSAKVTEGSATRAVQSVKL